MERSDLVLEFLSVWRTGKQVREEFDLSNTEWYNTQKWLRNINAIEVIETLYLEDGVRNRMPLYKRKN
jgi:hypothetical protein